MYLYSSKLKTNATILHNAYIPTVIIKISTATHAYIHVHEHKYVNEQFRDCFIIEIESTKISYRVSIQHARFDWPLLAPLSLTNI